MSLYTNQNHFAKILAFDLERTVLLMVYYSAGSMESWIKTNDKLKLIFQLLHGSFEAINCLHILGIIHNDIKSANVLVDVLSDEEVCAKLTGIKNSHKNVKLNYLDFGVANIIDRTTIKVKAFQINNRRGLSILYASPERINRAYMNSFEYSTKMPLLLKSADLYSMSIVISELLTRKKPWAENGYRQ